MKVVIDNIPPWNGEWPLADFYFTNRELHRIKQISGLRAGELIEALDANDSAAYVGVAVVALERAGKNIDPDEFWDAPVGSISLNLEEADVDAVPLDVPAGDEPSESGAFSTPASDNGSAS